VAAGSAHRYRASGERGASGEIFTCFSFATIGPAVTASSTHMHSSHSHSSTRTHAPTTPVVSRFDLA
jgi:hypothetical protein